MTARSLKPIPFTKVRESAPRLSAPYTPGRRSSRFWTDAELAILKEHYPKGGLSACMAHLPPERCSRSGIYEMARKLSLTSPNAGGGPKQKIDVPDDIDDQIRAAWSNLDGRKKGEVAALADQLGVPRWWLTKRATALQLVIAHKKEPPWSQAENDLMRHVPLHDLDRCARIFRDHGFSRSATAIGVRAKRLSLSRRPHETLSANAAAKILGIDGKAITALCISGELKAGRRGSQRLPQQGGDAWAIEPADLRRWIIDHVERVDLRKVEKFGFVALLGGEL